MMNTARYSLIEQHHRGNSALSAPPFCGPPLGATGVLEISRLNAFSQFNLTQTTPNQASQQIPIHSHL